jgi:hypothetical protein
MSPVQPKRRRVGSPRTGAAKRQKARSATFTRSPPQLPPSPYQQSKPAPHSPALESNSPHWPDHAVQATTPAPRQQKPLPATTPESNTASATYSKSNLTAAWHRRIRLSFFRLPSTSREGLRLRECEWQQAFIAVPALAAHTSQRRTPNKYASPTPSKKTTTEWRSHTAPPPPTTALAAAAPTQTTENCTTRQSHCRPILVLSFSYCPPFAIRNQCRRHCQNYSLRKLSRKAATARMNNGRARLPPSLKRCVPRLSRSFALPAEPLS